MSKDGELIWITKFSPSSRVRLPALALRHAGPEHGGGAQYCDILPEYWISDDPANTITSHAQDWPLDENDRWHLAVVDELDDKTLAVLMKWTLTHG